MGKFTTIEKVNRVLGSKLTSYKIAKDCGLSPQFIDNYRTGKSKVENMALGKAQILASYHDDCLIGKVRSVGKQQFINMAEDIDNLEDARRFLQSTVYGYQSKEGALNTFKHAIFQKSKGRRMAEGERVIIGGSPDEAIPWLKELSVDDIVDR